MARGTQKRFMTIAGTIGPIAPDVCLASLYVSSQDEGPDRHRAFFVRESGVRTNGRATFARGVHE